MGQAVSGSGGFNSGTEVVTIADLNQMIINAHINQADITRLKRKQEVSIEIEAIPGSKLKGEIERLAPQATVRNGIKGFAVRILLKSTDDRVRPGMTANLTIPISTADHVLSVPLAAVFTEQGERYVYVKNEDKMERRSVEIGVADFFYVEIQKGLIQGDVVALEQPSDMKNEKNGRSTNKVAIAQKPDSAKTTNSVASTHNTNPPAIKLPATATPSNESGTSRKVS